MPTTSNILSFSTDGDEISIRYVDDTGARLALDLTEYIDARVKAAVENHVRRLHPGVAP